MCDVPRCRRETTLRYLGICLCKEHWRELSDADPVSEKEVLRGFGYQRNESGEVVPLEVSNVRGDELPGYPV